MFTFTNLLMLRISFTCNTVCRTKFENLEIGVLNINWWIYVVKTNRRYAASIVTLLTTGPVFCLLIGVSSGFAQPITGQVTEVTWPVIGRAHSELTVGKGQKTGDKRSTFSNAYYPLITLAHGREPMLMYSFMQIDIRPDGTHSSLLSGK